MRLPQDDEEKTDTHLQGMQVSHAVSDFGEGSRIILTLTDHSMTKKRIRKMNM